MTTAAVHPDGAPRRARAAGTLSAFALLLGGLGLLHALMWLYDLQHPERFLDTDRALVRIDVIERFAQTWREGGDLAAFAAAHGIVGDWLPHALIYLAGGPPLVIAVQALLALASVAWVRDIGLRLALTQGQAAAAAALYALLPHTLVFPHQLATEAISVPLVVLSFALVLRSPAAGRQARAGLAMGLATLVRPVTMLWPIVHALAAWRATPAARLAYLAAGLAPLLLWMGFIFNATQEFSMGRSRHDLAHNLYHRVQRMAAHLPPHERFADRAEARLGVGDYLRFVAAHPGPALAHAGRDMMALGLKSGVERVVIDYLALYPGGRRLQDPQAGWRKTVEQNGVVQGVLRLAQENPGLIAVSFGGAALFVVFMALALLGACVLLRNGRWMLVAFVLYIFVTATVVDAAQSRQRAPAEFALCLLAVTGFCALQRRRLDGR
jgi:4-amino-4-deoxy-L-arabinose transferase-like glycosyltransferase